MSRTSPREPIVFRRLLLGAIAVVLLSCLGASLVQTSWGRVEVIDFAPRFYQHGRIFAPVGLVRIVRKLAGRPRVRVRFLPRARRMAGRVRR